MTRPSELRIPVFYPNDYAPDGAGMSQRDYDEGEVGGDNLRTIAELLEMPTFNLLEPEFQRRYIAMVAAAWVEAGLLLGVGTGWRSEKEQAANHLRWPNQFAPVSASNHMRKPPRDVAYAIDSVPYDALNWAHSNCGRFGINYLDHIPNERHHCAPIELPNSGTAYWADPVGYSTAAAVVLDLPYLRHLSLEFWLDRDAVIRLDGSDDPEPIPTPDPPEEDDDMRLKAAVLDSNPYYVGRGDGSTRTWLRNTEYKELKKRYTAGTAPEYVHPITGEPIATFDAIPVLTETEMDLYVGYPVDEYVRADEG